MSEWVSIDGKELKLESYSLGVDLAKENDFSAAVITDGKITVQIPMDIDPSTFGYLKSIFYKNYFQDVINRWFLKTKTYNKVGKHRQTTSPKI